MDRIVISKEIRRTLKSGREGPVTDNIHRMGSAMLDFCKRGYLENT